MKKPFDRYFGKNIVSKIYAAGIVLIAIGVVVAFAYSAFYGIPVAALGVLLFFITSAFKVSDSDLDEFVAKRTEEYAEQKIEGKAFGKKTLEAKDFSVFNGFFCDSNDVKFKSGRDGKVRTSRFFITAVSVSKGEAHIFSTDYELLSDSEIRFSEIHLSKDDEITVKKVESEFPRGIFAITINTSDNDVSFYLPDDALADQLISDIERMN